MKFDTASALCEHGTIIERIKKITSGEVALQFGKSSFAITGNIQGTFYSIQKTSINSYSVTKLKGDLTPTKENVTLKNEGFIFNLDQWLLKISQKKSDSHGKIYLVSDGVYTKIGATKYNVSKRRNELQTGNAKELIVVGFYNVKNKLTTEKYLHKKYSEKNILGEWFELTPLDLKDILSKRESKRRSNAFEYLTPANTTDIEATTNLTNTLFVEYNNLINKWRRSLAEMYI